MLKVNVGLSRKLSRDYNSTGYSVNLEGEVSVPLDDPEAVIEKIREYYDLADEALRVQIDRYESDSAIASRDEEPRQHVAHEPAPPVHQPQSRFAGATGNVRHESNGGSVPATNKQIQYLLNLGKRHGLTKPQLENRIAGILGHPIDIYSLSKQEAGAVLDDLSGNGQQRSRQN